jgi:hypothetical protein
MPSEQDKPLQTATAGPTPKPVAKLEDDDPNAPDETAPDTDVEEYDSDALRRLFNLPSAKKEEDSGKGDATEEDAEDEPAEEPEAATEEPAKEPAEEPAGEPAPVDPDDVPKFTQKQLAAIMAHEKRISREAQATLKELETVAGMPIDKLRESYRTQQAQKLVDDHGMSEAEATAIVADREKARQLEARMASQEAELASIRRQQVYAEQRAKYANHPNVKRYEAEIDQFARQSAGWDYGLAVVAVLGQKARDGLLQQEVADITRQQTIANVAKGNVRVEPSRQAAPNSPATSLSAETRRMVAEMKGIVPGLTERGVAKQAEQMKRQGRR